MSKNPQVEVDTCAEELKGNSAAKQTGMTKRNNNEVKK